MKTMMVVLFFFFVAVPTAHASDGLHVRSGDATVRMQTAANDSSDTDFQNDFDEETPDVEVPDPLESVNRVIFRFNDKVYFYLLKPVARAYRVVPEPARVSVGNFFSNLFTPVRFVNALLQLKLRDAGNELTRFLVDTTVGGAGFFDPAGDNAGLAKKEEDFGQSLGHYGVGEGFYLVLPFLGPSNLRDGIGLLADGALNPIYYLGISDGAKIGVRAYYSVNAVSLDKDTYESIKKESLDPYLFIRNAYSQRRDGLIQK